MEHYIAVWLPFSVCMQLQQ